MSPERFGKWLQCLLDDAGFLTPEQTCQAAAQLLAATNIDQDTAREFASNLTDADKVELAMFFNNLDQDDDLDD